MRDNVEDAVDVRERGVGPLEGEETDRATGAGSGGSSNGGGGGSGGGGTERRGVDTTDVLIVSVIAVKLPRLVNGEPLGCRKVVSMEASCPS